MFLISLYFLKAEIFADYIAYLIKLSGLRIKKILYTIRDVIWRISRYKSFARKFSVRIHVKGKLHGKKTKTRRMLIKRSRRCALQNLTNKVSYGYAQANNKGGSLGVKVYLFS